MIDEYLEKLNSNLNFGRVKESEELQKKSFLYKKIKRLPLILSTYDGMSKERFSTFTDWPVFTYSEIFKNYEKMLLNELLPIYEGSIIKDDRVNIIRANYGVGLIPSLFKLKIKQKGDNLPWVKSIDSINELKKIIKNGIPKINGYLVDKLNEAHEYFKEKLNQYPNLKKCIHIRLPDNQGPFNLAGIILGEKIYLYLHTYKSIIKDFLELLTYTYIDFTRQQKK